MMWNQEIRISEENRNVFVTKAQVGRGDKGIFTDDTARNNFAGMFTECGIQLIPKPEMKRNATEFLYIVGEEDKYVMVNITFSQYRNNLPVLIVNLPEPVHMPQRNGREMRMFELMNCIGDKLTSAYNPQQGGKKRRKQTRRKRRVTRKRKTK